MSTEIFIKRASKSSLHEIETYCTNYKKQNITAYQ